MERKSYGGPIAMTSVGGVLMTVSMIWFFYALVFSAFAKRGLRETAVIFWILTLVFLAAGIPLLCVGISKLKAARRYNNSPERNTAQPVYAYNTPLQQTAPAGFCTYCGNAFFGDEHFCTRCGKQRNG